MNSEFWKFMHEAAGRDQVLGKFDCCLWLADWVMRVKKIPDPAKHLRGKYTTKREYEALTGPFGPALTVSRICRKIGLKPTDDPLLGDIGVTYIKGLGIVGTICGYKGWVILMQDNTILRLRDEDHKLVRAWRV